MGLAISKLHLREPVTDPRSGKGGASGLTEFATCDGYAITRDGPCYVVVDSRSSRACEYPVALARCAVGVVGEEKPEQVKPATVTPPDAQVSQPANQAQQWKGNGKHGGRR